MGRRRGIELCTKGMCFILFAVLAFWVRVPIARAVSEAEQTFLAMYFTAEELAVVSATRSLQSIARVAENITVVTANDIELMNAHTLADVLQVVNGVRVVGVGVGSISMTEIQGSDFYRPKVLWDGIPINSLDDNVAELGRLPVTEIERVEILKGPASSAWGSALGGVVNVVTRGTGQRPVEGQAQASWGAHDTGDLRATLAGRIGWLGYSLSGTRLVSDGLVEGFDLETTHFAARLEADLAAVRLRGAVYSFDTERGDGSYPVDDTAYRNEMRTTLATLGASAELGQGITADLSGWSITEKAEYPMIQISDGAEIFSSGSEQPRQGGSLQLSWKRPGRTAVLGADYSHGRLEMTTLPDEEPTVTTTAVFANTMLEFGPLAITPGLRYDDISNTEAIWSPSLGATWLLGEQTILRATAARGFCSPTIAWTSASNPIFSYQANPELVVEKVWSYQAGVESDLLHPVWLKLTVFRHDVENALTTVDVPDTPTYTYTRINSGRQRREGVETALRTRPWHGLTATAGATWISAVDRETGDDLISVPNRQYNLELKYDDGRGLRFLAQGHYYHEREIPDTNARYTNMIVDLHGRWRTPIAPLLGLELFCSIHNLFDGDLYFADIYPNPGRWIEAGASVTF